MPLEGRVTMDYLDACCSTCKYLRTLEYDCSGTGKIVYGSCCVYYDDRVVQEITSPDYDMCECYNMRECYRKKRTT